MSFKVRNQIDTRGMIAYYDAYYPNSASSGSLSWKDISRNNGDCTLINGAYYNSSSYSGSIYCDGADDYIYMPYPSITTQSFAVEVWYDCNPGGGYLRAILSCGNLYGGGNDAWPPGFTLGYWTGNNQFGYGITDETGTTSRARWFYNPMPPVGKPAHLFFHRNTETQQISLTVNGTMKEFFSLSNATSIAGHRNYLSGDAYGGPSQQGNFYMTKLYLNRNFTDAEILDNFNLTRARFGI